MTAMIAVRAMARIVRFPSLCRHIGEYSIGFSVSFHIRNLELGAETDSPFATVPREYRRGVVWVEPRLVVEVEFTTWTSDGILRHPSFQGLRTDKPARDVGLERATR